MEKKKGVILFTILVLILISFSVNAASVSDDGYKCLNKKIDDKTCSGLTLEENIFSTMATEKCKNQLISAKKPDNCWGSGNSCSVKETAQAMIALTTQGDNVSSSIPWLLNQTQKSMGFDWLLQIDTLNTAASCTLNTSSSSNSIQIGENGKLTGQSSSCFSIKDDYWVEIKSNCYNEDFEISCNESFSTNLLFKKASNFFVLDSAESVQSQEKIIEKVKSFCFKKGTSCNYETSLWAVFALNLAGEDISSYIPYLMAMKDSNQKYLPESFLYYLTGDISYSASIKSKQKLGRYWLESGNKYYDTSVALLPFSEDFDIKNNTINWLEEDQDNKGCWNSGSIKDTAFLLYSIWPIPPTPPALPSCASEGYYCSSDIICSELNGTETNYSCFGVNNVCCDKTQPEPICSDIGEICGSDEVCSVSLQSTSDTSECCVGNCEIPEPAQTTSECVDNYGNCITDTSCVKGEKIANFSCSESNETCCVTKTKANLTWLWVVLFVILILAAVIFLFRKKIFKPKAEEVPRAPRRPRMPPTRTPPRRTPIQARPTPRPAPVVRPTSKVAQQSINKEPSRDEVLRKLKEMGK